ncbi:hypothetical protein MiYa_03532 [Microcystis aeruginosa NIES-2519]|uniref:Uncharacterized protein n=1 Tax=Microcystis aeruginosa NIES-2519 TaxID=2303981 RepID=A0A5A5RAS4_MICAE|nr:hypothetical protein MiYa_03532 [Microcystis aeruginosa NIES-2519]
MAVIFMVRWEVLVFGVRWSVVATRKARFIGEKLSISFPVLFHKIKNNGGHWLNQLSFLSYIQAV